MPKANKGGMTANIMFFATALIWGFAFAAQRRGADYLTPFYFNTIRYILGGFSLIPVVLIFERKGTPWRDKKLWIASVAAGFVLYAASALQQAGVMLTGDAGKSGFITGLYTVLVPILCALLFRQKTNINMWIGAVFATVGLYLLSVTGGISSVSLGDLLLFIGAFFWAGHIIVIDRMGGTLTSLRFACLQFFICGILSGITALIFEQPTTMDHVMAAAIPLAYCAFMSTGVAYTLQIVGQKFSSNPTLAAIIFSLESVFAALGGMLLLHERMHLQGYIGCLLIFTGIVLSQLKRKEKHT
jgi:drug/metabolite transporter (DMT)-like permease